MTPESIARELVQKAKEESTVDTFDVCLIRRIAMALLAVHHRAYSEMIEELVDFQKKTFGPRESSADAE